MPRTAAGTPSKEILEAALQGLELQKQRLDEQIGQVRGLMGKRSAGRPAKAAASTTTTPAPQESAGGRGGRKRTLSAEARKRIAAAQKKRWANFRKSQQ
jgi:hypothetical protein